jgi:hypothetical protein
MAKKSKVVAEIRHEQGFQYKINDKDNIESMTKPIDATNTFAISSYEAPPNFRARFIFFPPK